MNDEEFKEFGDFMAKAAVRHIVLKRIESGVYKIQNSYNNILVIKDDRSAWSVVGVDGRVIVPFKKYGWIDGFQQGLARVRTSGLTIPDDNTFRFYTDLESNTYIEGKENIKEYLNKSHFCFLLVNSITRHWLII